MPVPPITTAAARPLLAAAAAAGFGVTGCLHVVRDRPAVPSAQTPCVAHACGAACDTHGGGWSEAPTYAPPAPAPAPPAFTPLPAMPAPLSAPPVERYSPGPPADAGSYDGDIAPPPPLVAPAGYTRLAAPRR